MQKMRNMPHVAIESAKRVASASFSALNRQPLLAVVIAMSLCVVTIVHASDSNGLITALSFNTLAPTAAATSQDYSRFSHSTPREHADLMGRSNCGSCHRRGDSSATPRLPVHKDCIGCHLVQFTAAASSYNPMCTICHTREGLNSPNPPMKNFTGLISFNAKFDHAQHLLGIDGTRPAESCAACHRPANRGVAQTIPARLSAHQTCYQCHSPGKQAGNSSSCGSCHEFGRYSRTPIAARSYGVGFSHADHGSRKRLTCESCHRVKAQGLPQRQQVTSLLPAQHYANPRAQTCKTCHNGKRTFGDAGPGFTDCVRCHKGMNFKT